MSSVYRWCSVTRESSDLRLASGATPFKRWRGVLPQPCTCSECIHVQYTPRAPCVRMFNRHTLNVVLETLFFVAVSPRPTLEEQSTGGGRPGRTGALLLLLLPCQQVPYCCCCRYSVQPANAAAGTAGTQLLLLPVQCAPCCR